MIVNEKLDKQVVESYKNGETLSVILSCFNIGKGTLYAILDENKVPRRQNKNYKKEVVRCRHCGAILMKESKFCHMCGKVAITDKQVALNDLQYVIASAGQIGNIEQRKKFLEKCEALKDYIEIKGLS